MPKTPPAKAGRSKGGLTPKQIDAACRALPGVTMDVLWGADEVYKVGGRMFAVIGSGGTLSFKANDVAFEMLCETGAARPAPYAAKNKWVLFDDTGTVAADELRQYLAMAHQLVAAKLSGKLRKALGVA